MRLRETNMMMKTPHPQHQQRGFSMIEALVALLVMSFGMLALAGMQASVSYGGDMAKQRGEAMRLAQERIEQMRSYTGVSTGTINWNGIDALTDGSGATLLPNTNATYTVTSSMAGADTDPARAAQVSVTWTDRAGVAQTLTMSTVIARNDPKDTGFLLSPLPSTATLRRPFDRNIDIPVRSISLGNGSSSYQLSANFALIFNDASGNVVQICDPGVANATAAQILASSCTTTTGYILSGFLSRDSNSLGWPTGVNFSGITRTDAASQGIRCDMSLAVSQATGATLDSMYYLCVVPVVAPSASVPASWSGTFRFGGVSTSSNYIVCRYQYTDGDSDANDRNVQPYVNVQDALDQQNYRLATHNSGSSSSLSGSTSACPSAMTVSGVSTGVVHQDCRSANSARATECPAVSP
jgi:Tfp pilus assembly protein PilV